MLLLFLPVQNVIEPGRFIDSVWWLFLSYFDLRGRFPERASWSLIFRVLGSVRGNSGRKIAVPRETEEEDETSLITKPVIFSPSLLSPTSVTRQSSFNGRLSEPSVPLLTFFVVVVFFLRDIFESLLSNQIRLPRCYHREEKRGTCDSRFPP